MRRVSWFIYGIICSMWNIGLLLLGYYKLDSILGKIIFGVGCILSILSWVVVIKHTDDYPLESGGVKK